MWKFSGNIDYSCEECESSGVIPVEDFEIDCVGGDERQMGPELCYELAYEFSCPDCDNEISLKFYVYEYPVNCLNFIDNQSSGAETNGEPDFEYLPELYSAEDILHLYSSIKELVVTLRENPYLLRDISHREFEEVVAELFRAKGYQVDLTKRTRDGGKDIIAIHTDHFGIKSKYFIECKHYAESNKIGVDVVRTLHGVKNTKDGPNKTIVATTSTFTEDARKFVDCEISSKWDMSLADHDEIVRWLQSYR